VHFGRIQADLTIWICCDGCYASSTASPRVSRPCSSGWRSYRAAQK
jgi:hypothetical protein